MELSESGSSRSKNTEENILYDVLLFDEWPQDTENVSKSSKEKYKQVSLYGRGLSSTQFAVGSVLRTVGYPLESYSPCALPESLVKLINSQLQWQLAVSNDGKDIAILQDQFIEIRSQRDDFGSVIGRCTIARDNYPQWRTMAWSPDNTMFACSDSSGNIEVFDLVGTKICNIFSITSYNPNMPIDLSRALAGLFFTAFKPEESSDWVQELIVITFQGNLTSYLISADSGYKKSYSFSLSSQYPYGISNAIYHPMHKLIIVGGTTEQTHNVVNPIAKDYGITAWRPLDIPPYWKLVTDYEDNGNRRRTKSFISRISSSVTSYKWSAKKHDGLYRLCLSPSGKTLVSLHQSGKLALWDVPSLKLRNIWEQEDQPGIEEQNPNIVENMQRRKAIKDLNLSPSLIDANWWSEEAVILARGNGALTVSSINTMKNLLGTSPEWIEPSPRVSTSHEGGFIGLECECKYSGMKRRLVSSDGENEDDDDSDDDEDAGIVQKTTGYMKSVLYYVTDSERFTPPRKRARVVNRTYRLFGLKSTTPEELYARKIDDKEYGEALMLAKAYKLDCDLVYQRQWREETPVSVASIQDYLSKISKRAWVLHECLERVPEGLDAMRELLQYGLRGTDAEALVAIGKGTDAGKFILCDVHHYEDLDEHYDEDEEIHRNRLKKLEDMRRTEFLEQVNFACLTLEQRELCRARAKLLQYLDRLSTYEMILGGTHIADERYDHTLFKKFRSQNIVEAAVEYAQNGDWKAVDCIFTYHGEDVLPHRFGILSNFPETSAPDEYRSLLPEAGMRIDDPDVEPWQTEKWREKDWCEIDPCKSAIDPNPADLGAFIYEKNPELLQYKGVNLRKSDLTEWYSYRACEIERLSRQVEHSIDLMKLAMERGVQGLESVYNDLLTMETLVFEGYVSEDVKFDDIRSMSELDKLQLLMSLSNEKMFEKNVWRWLVPFLSRCETNTAGSSRDILREFVINMAKTDLVQVVKIFENSKVGMKNRVIADDCEFMVLALECLYVCERDDQLNIAFKILHCLPHKGYEKSKPEVLRLHQQIDELEQHLKAADILEKNKLPKTLKYIKDTQSDFEETKNLMTRLSRSAGRRTPPPTEMEWKKIQLDMLELCTNVFKCMQPKFCHEIFTESLLCSGWRECITLAGETLERTRDSTDTGILPSVMVQHKVSYTKAVQLVISAAREYFNSSTNLVDPCMELARSCLTLIHDCHPEIIEELDLISALAVLDDCGLKILPLQVRLCKDRLQLIQQAIDAKFSVYFNQAKLLKLGYLLRVQAENSVERDGRVLQLVAQAALKGGNHKTALEVCMKLMDAGYAPIWKECKQLAEVTDFKEIKPKFDLLSFAVTHCTPDMIEPILRARSLLETQMLYERLQTEVKGTDSADGGCVSKPSVLSPAGALQQTKELLSTTSETTRTVLSALSDKNWWSSTLSNLTPSRVDRESGSDDQSRNNKSLELFACHPFYDDIMENAYLDQDSVNYRTGQCTSIEHDTNHALLRTAKLEETLTEGGSQNPATEVLLQLARDAMAKDTTLALAYLLALSEISEAEKCLSSLPRTQLTLELSAYFYALQVYNKLKPFNEPRWNKLYGHFPMEIVHVLVKKGVKKLPKEMHFLGVELLKYSDLLSDFLQAQTLQKLGKGVDVARFTQDNEYKEETILGLVMTLDENVMKVAVSLAEKYELPLWDLYMTHLEFLFSESGLSTTEIDTRVKKLQILPLLKSQGRKFWERMNTYVYPTISGTDQSRHLYYYTLLLDIDEHDERIDPDSHVKILRKLMPATSGLNYKNLMEGIVDPLTVLGNCVTGNNVSVLSKLANRIPDQNGGHLKPSSIYALWAKRFFWQGDQRAKKRPENMGEWIHRYEACSEWQQRLLPEDMVLFIDGVTFSAEARSLTDECRAEILRRATKYCKQGGKKKKLDPVKMTWEEASEHFTRSQVHLERLAQDTIIAMRYAEDATIKGYADMFDSSRSEPEKLSNLLLTMVIDGQTPDMIQDILDVAPIDRWSSKTVFQEAINHIIQSVRQPEPRSEILGETAPVHALKKIVESCAEHIKCGGDIVTQEDVMSILRPFSADSEISVQPRLEILRILEQAFLLEEADSSLLVYYRSEAIVNDSWTNVRVTESEVQSDDNRQRIFEKLLSESTSMKHLLSLCNLLSVWPALKSAEASNPDVNPWCLVLSEMVKKYPESGKSVLENVISLQPTSALSSQCIRQLFTLLKESDQSVCAIKVVLHSGYSELYELAISELQSHKAVLDDSEEFMELLLKCRLTPSTVRSHYYPKVIEYLVSRQVSIDQPHEYINTDEIAKQLHSAGFVAESGSLLLLQRGTHSSLRTFDAALAIFSKWLKQ
ncbi:NBAS subunit of NRZ tethering complex-like [Tubulanus polymorphus]|uniref:NBAS subunit of NRZ tethering complex-like n=1 Tax=Tubulanus polymorphus TaxID=672921 RepID=UPI003DA52003